MPVVNKKLNSKSTNLAEQRLLALGFIEGIQKHLSKTPLMIGGRVVKPSDLQKTLQRRIELLDQVRTARGAFRSAVQKMKAHQASTRAELDGFQQLVIAMYGGNYTVLADFQLAPRKKRSLSIETKAAAVEKRVATRKARGTTGSRARAKVHGAVP
jgi:hypothetical protein